MKKVSQSFLLLALVFALVLPNLVVFADSINDGNIFPDSQSSNSTTKQSENANNETIELARTVVQKTSDAVVFSYYDGTTLEEQYENAKFVSPEISVLETKPDAALALIALYVEVLSDFREYDIDSYRLFWKNASDKKTVILTDSLKHGQELYGKIKAIEALLALDHYCDLLSEQEYRYMIDAFEEVASLNFASSSKIYDDAVFSTYFEKYRATSENSTREIGDTYVFVGTMQYYLGDTVYTTSRRSISTFSAPREWNYDEKDDARAEAEALGYTDLVYDSQATTYYNCHAYAWHSTLPGRKWIGNTMTINNTLHYGVERYVSDPHCTMIEDSNNIQAGDIIVYRRNGTIMHSGIVIGINPIRIRSKWGQGCVWEHNVSSVPSSYKEVNGTVNVTYYRYGTSHNVECCEVDDDTHERICSICSYNLGEENHTISYTSTGTTSHTRKCNQCGHTLSDEAHDLDYVEAGSVRHRVFCKKCNYSKLAVHIFENNKCYYCDYVRNNLNSIGDESAEVE